MECTDRLNFTKMEGFPTMFSLCVAVLSLAVLRTQVAGRYLHDLRQFRQIGVGGRFVVDRDTLEGIIRNFKEDSLSSSKVDFALPHGLPRADYDEQIYGELVIGEFEFREPYFDDESGEEVEAYRRSLTVGLPFASGDQHGMIFICEITDSPTTTPVSVNRAVTTQADLVDVDSSPGRETVTYRSGNDTIRLVKEYSNACDGRVGDDFDGVLGKNIHFLNSHGHFDWGCDKMEQGKSGYCKRLEAYEEEIEEAGGNVCVVEGTSTSTRCPASMTIEGATGAFRELFSGLMVDTPVASFEAEWIDRVHQTGIMYPCID